MSIYKVLNFAAKGFGEADDYIDLGFAQVILFLLVKLHHAQGNTGGIAELLLGKAPGLPDGVQLRLPGFLVSANNGICGFHKLGIVSLMVDIHGEDGGEGQPIRNNILKPSAALPLVVGENPTGPVFPTLEIRMGGYNAGEGDVGSL